MLVLLLLPGVAFASHDRGCPLWVDTMPSIYIYIYILVCIYRCILAPIASWGNSNLAGCEYLGFHRQRRRNRSMRRSGIMEQSLAIRKSNDVVWLWHALKVQGCVLIGFRSATGMRHRVRTIKGTEIKAFSAVTCCERPGLFRVGGFEAPQECCTGHNIYDFSDMTSCSGFEGPQTCCTRLSIYQSNNH